MGITRLAENKWRLEWYPEGRRKDPRTGKPNTKRETFVHLGDEASARELFQELNRHGSKTPKLSPTFRDCINEYLIYYSNKNTIGTVADWKLAWFHHLEPVFGHCKPNRLTPAMIESYKAERTRTHKPRTVDKELTYLKGFISWMVENHYADPLTFRIRGFSRNKTAAPPTFPLSPAQVDAVLCQLLQPQQDMCKLIYQCGLRKSEAFNITVGRVRTGYLMILGKGSRERVVPITQNLQDMLQRHCEGKGSGEYVFTNPHTGKPFTNVDYGLKQAAKRAGIDTRVYPHLLRHSALTHLAQHGANAYQIKAIAGHSDIETSQKYVHLALDNLRGVMENINRSLNDSKS